MKLCMDSVTAAREEVALEFPDPDSPTGKTRTLKHPYIDRHLPGHPGYDPRLAHIPLQVRPVAVESGGGTLYPTAYLVRQEAHSTIRAHFHRIDQFQVFVGGAGRFGAEHIDGVQVHYANGYSAYGPIRAGARGIDYFTLRTGWDKGAIWMPEAREQQQRERNRPLRNIVYAPLASLPALDGVAARVDNLGQADDGLGVWTWRATAGQSWTGPVPAAGNGQYWLVVTGALDTDCGPQPAMSLLFVSADEAALTVHATAPDTTVIVMQYPRLEN